MNNRRLEELKFMTHGSLAKRCLELEGENRKLRRRIKEFEENNWGI